MAEKRYVHVRKVCLSKMWGRCEASRPEKFELDGGESLGAIDRLGWAADIDLRKRAIPSIAFILAACGCSDFAEPRAQDAAPIYGCYVAPEAPSIKIASVGVTIDGIRETAPSRYEFAKVGAMVRMPFAAHYRDGQYKLVRSTDHLFRVVHTATGPTLLIAFGPHGHLRRYRRSSSNECVS